MMIKYNNNEKHYKSMMEKVETKLDETIDEELLDFIDRRESELPDLIS